MQCKPSPLRVILGSTYIRYFFPFDAQGRWSAEIAESTTANVAHLRRNFVVGGVLICIAQLTQPACPVTSAILEALALPFGAMIGWCLAGSKGLSNAKNGRN